MRVSISHPILFFEHNTYKSTPNVYTDTHSIKDAPPHAHCPALVYNTDTNKVTPESAARFIENTTVHQNGSVEKLSSSLISYLIHLYAAKRAHDTKQRPSVVDLSSKPHPLTPECQKTYGIPSISKGTCSVKSTIHSTVLSTEAKYYCARKICETCWNRITNFSVGWHTLKAIKQIIHQKVYDSHFAVLETPDIWHTILADALVISVPLAAHFVDNPITIASIVPKITPIWTRMCGTRSVYGITAFLTETPTTNLLRKHSITLFSIGWVILPLPTFHIRSRRSVLAPLSLEMPRDAAFVYRKTASNLFIYSYAFYNCMALLTQAKIRISLRLTAPQSKCIRLVGTPASNIRPNRIVSGPVIACEHLTWESLSILLSQSSALSLSGSYSAASSGIHGGVSGVTVGSAFMYLIDWAIQQAPFHSVCLEPIDQSYRPTAGSLSSIDDTIIPAWNAAIKAIQNFQRPQWPPAPSPCHPPLPKIKALTLPAAKDIRAARKARESKRPYTDILSPRRKKKIKASSAT